jgi:hypothetical protein
MARKVSAPPDSCTIKKDTKIKEINSTRECESMSSIWIFDVVGS